MIIKFKKLIKIFLIQDRNPKYQCLLHLILKLQNSRRSVVDKALRELEKYEDAQPVTGRINRQIEEKKVRLNTKTSMIDKLNKEQELEDEQNQSNVRARTKRSDEASKTIAKNFRKFNQPRTKFLSYDSPMSVVEISVAHLKKEEKDLPKFLGSLKEKLIIAARKLLIMKTNMKFGLGVNATFASTDSKTDVTNTVSTKHMSVNSKAEVPRVMDSLIDIAINMFEHINHKGSGYTIKKINHVFLKSFKVKPLRGSSCIPTPEKFANSRCGLVNIKNEDNECFKWCMKYHQTKKEKNCDRTTVLSKIEDKYNYENVNFPAGFDDIETFEKNNKVAVFVYNITDGAITREKVGDPEYVCNDVIYLLRIEQEELSHYVYIKHLSRLININFNGKATGKNLCPYCEKNM